MVFLLCVFSSDSHIIEHTEAAALWSLHVVSWRSGIENRQISKLKLGTVVFTDSSCNGMTCTNKYTARHIITLISVPAGNWQAGTAPDSRETIPSLSPDRRHFYYYSSHSRTLNLHLPDKRQTVVRAAIEHWVQNWKETSSSEQWGICCVCVERDVVRRAFCAQSIGRRCTRGDSLDIFMRTRGPPQGGGAKGPCPPPPPKLLGGGSNAFGPPPDFRKNSVMYTINV